MLYELCAEVRNWFVSEKHNGIFTVKDGNMPLDFLQDGQYFRILGSVYNDGVYQYPAVLTDEVFEGQIWAMRVPPAFIALSGEIDEYIADMEAFDDADLEVYLEFLQNERNKENEKQQENAS